MRILKSSLWNKILINLGFRDKELIELVSSFNGIGFPVPEKMTWDYCSKYYSIQPGFYGPYNIIYYVHPTICSNCKTPLVEEKWDWWKIEESGQYMVWSYTCPNGHGHFVEWA